MWSLLRNDYLGVVLGVVLGGGPGDGPGGWFWEVVLGVVLGGDLGGWSWRVVLGVVLHSEGEGPPQIWCILTVPTPTTAHTGHASRHLRLLHPKRPVSLSVSDEIWKDREQWHLAGHTWWPSSSLPSVF